jgi:chaperone BCS1
VLYKLFRFVVKKPAPWEVLKQFINEALDFEQTQEQEDTKVFTINERLLEWNIAAERPKRPLDSVFIKSDVKQDLVSDMEIFLKSKEFYAYHGIPYKRGYLLYGPPGCGKTSLVSGLAAKFSLNICLLQMGM